MALEMAHEVGLSMDEVFPEALGPTELSVLESSGIYLSPPSEREQA